MHETSLVRALLNQVEQLLAEHGGVAVEQIEVEIGPLSGVEPLLVQEAFGRLAPHTATAEARLIIREVPLQARCEDCGREFEMESFRFQCPACDSGQVRVLRGDEFRLLTVTLRQPIAEEMQA